MNYDLAVIGSGPGGYSAAIKAGQLGLDTAIIEKENIGGTCVNWGCIPTKALIEGAAKRFELNSDYHPGFQINDFDFDFSGLHEWKDEVVYTLVQGVKSQLQRNNVDIYRDEGIPLSGQEILLREKDETIKAKKTILAMGSKPMRLPIPGIDQEGVLTSKDLLSLEKIPASLAVIGGGVIGLEFAYIFNALGSEVSVIEIEDRVLPFEDREVAEKLYDSLQEQGVEFELNSELKYVKQHRDKLKLNLADDSVVEAEKVLMAVGREPNLPADMGIKVVKNNGYVRTDEYMQTDLEDVYAIGDIVDSPELAHVAFAEGITAAKNAAGYSEKVNYGAIPRVVYTHPEVAAAGLSESEAKKKYGDIETYVYPARASGRAMTMNKTDGFVKIIKADRYDEVVGAHIIGPNAGELISGPTLGMNLEITVEELAETIMPHPTLSESIMEAAHMAGTGSVHY